MGLPVTIKVNFRGNVKRFLAQDVDKLEWEAVEAWIKASFGINHFQVKYFDEDNEEICINSQDEYEEAIKSAEKQGNQLHMSVYKMKGQACGGPLKTEVKELKGDLRPAPPYPSRVKTVDKGTQVTPEREAVMVKDNKGNKPEDEPPPMWFRAYMEKFKDEVVKEVVERMCSDFSGQCCTHKSSDGPQEPIGAVGGVMGPKPGPSTSNGSLGYTPNCSSCNKLTSEGAYKCSVCPSCILCEMCRHSHDPSHNLVRTKTPLSIPEHGMSGELRFPRRGDRTVRKAERQRLKAERRQLRAEVKEIKKKLRLEKRGLQWSGPSTSGRANLTNVASTSTQVPALPPSAASHTASGPIPAPVPDPQASSPEGPGVSHSSLVPTMAALFVDENPDGTLLEPGIKFKYWKMKNTGTISSSETKLVFMWGNLTLASEGQREVPVPWLKPGQVGMVSVDLAAPSVEGTYTSHWRLAHCGEQFGPRIWCSIVVKRRKRNVGLGRPSKRPEQSPRLFFAGLSFENFYLPEVEFPTQQDLLSCVALDLNVGEMLERVHREDLPPCISPLPHVNPHDVLEKFPLSDMEEDNGVKDCEEEVFEPLNLETYTEEEISGTQFLCETIIRSLTLEEAPDHRPLYTIRQKNHKPKAAVVSRDLSCEKTEMVKEVKETTCALKFEFSAPSVTAGLTQVTQEEEERTASPLEPENENLCISSNKEDRETVNIDALLNTQDDQEDKVEGTHKEEEWDNQVISEVSSVSSDDYIVVLPDCFDTSRPLQVSTYGSTTLQPAGVSEALADLEPDENKEEDSYIETDKEQIENSSQNAGPQTVAPLSSNVNQMLCSSQILDTEILFPESLSPSLLPPLALYSPRSEALYLAEDPSPPAQETLEPQQPVVHLNVSSGLSRTAGSASSAFETYHPSRALQSSRGHRGITDGFLKGALSVATTAYKALFNGPHTPSQRGLDMLGRLAEMGFRDRQLNQRLLRKHFYQLEPTVNELVQMDRSRRKDGDSDKTME
ncbi:LOW QUALITY PROTEIN: NBR1 autophagy cargo receptor a [Pholidichthys leucotaenia]